MGPKNITYIFSAVTEFAHIYVYCVDEKVMVISKEKWQNDVEQNRVARDTDRRHVLVSTVTAARLA
jgi:hypothetical protein